ncbi:Retron-type RNA-directed DNA polymerase [Caballeronia sordidicola]|uniref:Retron-type RNA-directed DNA polymerase n=1 Tax=Caballeronia sordidicola TaxID=196367 RepID=A0A226WUI3_CABSO|nr:Retron-type RNA-directed DNA polymerase [Caballeronia sordidicola]
MRLRLEEFSLALHPDKTQLLEFGRYAAVIRKRYGLGKPETFTFLGFIFICGKSRRGALQLQRETRGDRMRTKLRDIKEQLRKRMHVSIPEQGKWLRQVVPDNLRIRRYPRFRGHLNRLADAWLPKPRILHPWPDQRFAVKHPR